MAVVHILSIIKLVIIFSTEHSYELISNSSHIYDLLDSVVKSLCIRDTMYNVHGTWI